jgi:hypothetical protein
VNFLNPYADFHLPQEIEIIQQDLGADRLVGSNEGPRSYEKMKNSHKTDRCIVNRSGWERRSLGKALGEVWQDLQADPQWKYEQLPPVQLLEKSELCSDPKNNNELVRATWFWSRRPRLLPAASSILWATVALGLPLWLFLVPSIGVPLIIVAALIISTELVRSVRWRRQYELSIDRLIRTVATHESGGPTRSNP